LDSPDRQENRRAMLSRTLFLKELQGILASRAYWVMLLILSPLVGYSFTQASRLFSEASRTALALPELARGMSPLDGIMVPTWGAFYLAMTLLFPFVAIRLIGDEKQSGSLKLLLQVPLSSSLIVSVKVLALASAWFIALVPTLSAVTIWSISGGHLHWPEILNLVLGYALYSLAIAGIAFFAASVTDSIATAAIVAIAFTLGSWVLDFASGTQSGWARDLSFLSLTAALRVFERGLLSSPQVLQLFLTALSLLGLTVVWLPPGIPTRQKLQRATVALLLPMLLIILSRSLPFYEDLTEDRRNAFNPADERALQAMEHPLQITVHLNLDDSRLREMEQNVLPKLRRTVSRLKITYAQSGKAGLFGAEGDEQYGLIVYEYSGKRDESHSTREEEILMIIQRLAGQEVTADPVAEYRGYPLVMNASFSELWFFGVLPALTVAAWRITQRPPRRKT
jgi:ABC-2 type transport system permease protein